jgi:hypothetical protein
VTTESVNDRQVGGKHYKSNYQHWDLVKDVGFDYYEGCATKYLTRRKGSREQDLQKAVHFLEKRCTLGPAREMLPVHEVMVQSFCAENDLSFKEYEIISTVVRGEYKAAISMINRILKDYGL